MESIQREDSVAAVVAALSPDLWRSLPPQLVAQRVVAAADRQGLVELLEEVPGAVVGPWEAPPEPADLHDPRVVNLVEFLEAFTWTKLSLPLLCRHMVAVLHTTA